MPDPNNNGQRVTNAVIFERLETLTKKVDNYIDESRKYRDEKDARIRNLELQASTDKTRIDAICGDIDDLQKRSNGWDIVNGVMVVIGSALAAIVGSQK